MLDEPLKDERGQEVGKLQGTFQFSHLPRFAQMLGGMCLLWKEREKENNRKKEQRQKLRKYIFMR